MTLTRALMAYLETHDLATNTERKLRHRLNCWLRHSAARTVSAVTDAAFARFRDAAQAAGLSMRTIEETVSDVARICGLRDVGRRLKGWKVTRCKPVPSIELFARAYLNADAAEWPVWPGLRRLELATVDNGTFWRAYLATLYLTALRESDMRALRWDQINDERIVFKAGKTGREHVFPVDRVLTRHLQPLRDAARSELVFPISDGQRRYARATLKAISGCDWFTAQPMRRRSITDWTTIDRTAGELVHGCGLGVLKHYIDGEHVLRAALLKRSWPDAFLTDEEREQRALQIDELIALARRMAPEKMGDFLRIGGALCA